MIILPILESYIQKIKIKQLIDLWSEYLVIKKATFQNLLSKINWENELSDKNAYKVFS